MVQSQQPIDNLAPPRRGNRIRDFVIWVDPSTEQIGLGRSDKLSRNVSGESRVLRWRLDLPWSF